MSDARHGVRGGMHQRLVERLGLQIASGALGEGSQVVPEQLGEELAASRTVVREALRALEAKGMVRPRPRVGTRVLPISEWNLLDEDVIRWRIAGPDRSAQLDELSDLRAAVEIYAARGCAAHATPDQVADLRSSCDVMADAAAVGDHGGFTAADIAFHSTILRASGNALFANFARPFAAFLHAREDLHTLPERVDAIVLQEHRDIVDAIARGDGDAAEQRARAVVERSRAEVGAALDVGGPGSPNHPACRDATP